MIYIISALMGYLIGSINASIIYSKLKGQDIRSFGSGNAGATNTLRAYGKGAAGVVLTGDILKGIIAVLIAKVIGDDVAVYIAGFAAIMGHNFPVYFGFKGGKGILTSLAVMTAVSPLAGIIALAFGVLVILVTRYVSLGSILGSVTFGIAAYIMSDDTGFRLFTLAVVILAVARHHENIRRLIKGTERKLGKNDK